MNKQAKSLLKINNKLEEQLSPEATMIMTDIIIYIRGANISDYHQESVRYDILQMVIDGEKRGDSIDTIIGSNYQAFCDEVLKEVPKLTAIESLIYNISLISLCLSVLSIMWLLHMMLNVIKGDVTLPYLPITTGQALAAVLIIVSAIGLYSSAAKTSFDKKAFSYKILFVLLFFVILAAFLLTTYLTDILLTLHVYLILAGILLLFLIYRIIDIKIG